jgi:hypothetical protein
MKLFSITFCKIRKSILNLNFDFFFFSIIMEVFNKALFLSQQKIFALTHWRVYTLMVNLLQILNQFVLLFRKNVMEKSSIICSVLPLVKINTRISETPCISNFTCARYSHGHGICHSLSFN